MRRVSGVAVWGTVPILVEQEGLMLRLLYVLVHLCAMCPCKARESTILLVDACENVDYHEGKPATSLFGGTGFRWDAQYVHAR